MRVRYRCDEGWLALGCGGAFSFFTIYPTGTFLDISHTVEYVGLYTVYKYSTHTCVDLSFGSKIKWVHGWARDEMWKTFHKLPPFVVSERRRGSPRHT